MEMKYLEHTIDILSSRGNAKAGLGLAGVCVHVRGRYDGRTGDDREGTEIDDDKEKTFR